MEKQHKCGCRFNEFKRPDGNVDCYLVEAVCEFHKQEQEKIYLDGKCYHKSILDEVEA